MIHCVTAYNAHTYDDALAQMFRRRYELFVAARGWQGLEHGSGIERDQFDTEDAVYLLSLGEDCSVLGGLRLLPTVPPHLLSEVFSQLAPGGVPRGPDTYEMTRYFTVRDRKQGELMRRVAGELLCAMFEFCLSAGVAWITTLFDTFFLRRMQHNRWTETTVLGPPQAYEEGTAIAMKFAASLTNLESTRIAHGIDHAVLLPIDRTSPYPSTKDEIRREKIALAFPQVKNGENHASIAYSFHDLDSAPHG